MVFGMRRATRARWFDPMLVRDNPVFVDPFPLNLCKELEFAGASEQVFEHPRILFEMLARDPRAAIEPPLRFPEFAENCLGDAASGVDGAGSGRNGARAMRRLGDVERGPGTESNRLRQIDSCARVVRVSRPRTPEAELQACDLPHRPGTGTSG